LEEILDSHEFRRDVWPPGEGDLARPLIVVIFSDEADLEITGRRGMVCGEEEVSLVCFPGTPFEIVVS